LKVNFTLQARNDLRAIKDWIAIDDERASERVVSRIRQTVLMFGQFPKLGHAGVVTGTREFKVTGLPYLIVYQIASVDEIDILTVIHSKRMYPPE
jgi:toxin ParE1/3/4